MGCGSKDMIALMLMQKEKSDSACQCSGNPETQGQVKAAKKKSKYQV